jgi:hypothetical protein
MLLLIVGQMLFVYPWAIAMQTSSLTTRETMLTLLLFLLGLTLLGWIVSSLVFALDSCA